MTEKGSILEINGKTVIVAPDLSDSCFGCMNQECKARGFISAENPLALPLAAGQVVEMEAPGVSLIKQALTAFLPPVLSFTTAYILTRFLFPNAGEGAAGGIGVIFLFAAAFIVYKARKRIAAGEVFTVTRIIEPFSELGQF